MYEGRIASPPVLTLTRLLEGRGQGDISTCSACQEARRAASAGGMGIALLRVEYRLTDPVPKMSERSSTPCPVALIEAKPMAMNTYKLDLTRGLVVRSSKSPERLHAHSSQRGGIEDGFCSLSTRQGH